MLDLSNAHILGKGSSRVCYVHPDDSGKCVKVIYTNHHEIMDEELKHYRRYVRRRISWSMMAEWHGVVDTSIGEGAVFSLPRDFDGTVSGSLQSYLRNIVNDGFQEQLREALSTFKAYLLRERITVRELKPENLLFQRLSPVGGKVVLIDGVGNNEFLPLANYSRLFYRRMLRKKWAKFREMVIEAGAGDLLS